MKQRQSIQRCNKTPWGVRLPRTNTIRRASRLRLESSGFTVVELLVSSSIGMIVLAMTMSSIFASREAIFYDFERTRLNQQLRGAFDILTANIREAGENLIGAFPAIEVIDGGGVLPDELVLRRNLIDEVLTVCQTVNSGTNDRVYFGLTYPAPNPATPGCIYTDNIQNFNSWSDYRLDQDGEARAYVFDRVTKVGEFFTYTGEVQNGSEMYIDRQGSWGDTYVVPGAGEISPISAYILEEYRFRLNMADPDANVLQLIENGREDQPRNVAPEISNFSVTVLMSDGTTQTSLANTDSWALVRALDITLTAQATHRDRNITVVASSRLLPRNIFSK